MSFFQTDCQISFKADHSPVTEADLAASAKIETELATLAPNIPILTEEQEIIAFDIRSQWPCYWLIDPLDGTHHFMKGSSEFTVNIALILENKPVLGVIYAPASQTYYYAKQGCHAYKQITTQREQVIHTRPVPPKCPIVINGSSNQHNHLLNNFLTAIGEYQLLTMGSSLKSCWVAEGKADIYPRLGPTSEWDTAAAQCILESAGGQLTNTRMQPLRYNTKASLLNPHFLALGDPHHAWVNYV